MNDARRVLIDAELDEALRADGYIVAELLDDTDLAALRTAQLELAGVDDGGLTIDFARSDRRAMRQIRELLQPVWDRRLPGLFNSYRPVVSTFVVKYPGPGSEMLLHNEPTFVEPELGPCYNIWIPLVDVDPSLDNGVLELVPGSQDLPYGLSGFDTPVLFRPFERCIRRFAVPVSVRAGQAVIYDTRMLHASRENRSGAPRPAIAAAVAPIGAPLIHVLSGGRHLREVYEVDEDFFLDHHPLEVRSALRGRYPLVDRRRHERAFTGSDVAEALGADEAPAPEVVLPPDVSEVLSSAGAGSLPVTEVPGTAPIEVPRNGHEGFRDARPTRDWGLQPVHGESRLVSIPEGDRRWDEAFGAAAAVVTGQLDRRSVVVVDPGARAELVGDLSRLSLVVLDAATVSAGVLHNLSVAQLEPGFRVELSAAGPALLWNEGACPLVVGVTEVERESDPGTPPAGRVRRLLGRSRRRA